MMPPTRSPSNRPPTVLLVSDRDATARWLRSVLESNGIAVTRAPEAANALHPARETPDLILVEGDASGAPVIGTCRELRAQPGVGPHTPILLATAVPLRRDERLAALRAGAWDVLGTPLDPEETLLKINAYARPKIAADAAASDTLVDAETQLYNVQGLARQARELAALATREHAPFACLVAGVDPLVGELAVKRWVRAFRDTARSSDVLGRLGPADFAVLAPITGAAGARELARRLAAAGRALTASGEETPVRLRIGYDAVENMAYAPVNAIELLGRAHLAERRAAAGGGSAPVAYGEPESAA